MIVLLLSLVDSAKQRTSLPEVLQNQKPNQQGIQSFRDTTCTAKKGGRPQDGFCTEK